MFRRHYIEKYRDAYNFDDIPQAYWDAATYDGHIYAIPADYNTVVLFYRADILEEHDIAVPETYADLLDACKQLREKGVFEYPYVNGMEVPNGLDASFVNAMHANKGTWFDDDGNPCFNDATGLQALQDVIDLYEYMPKDSLSNTMDDAIMLFQLGQAAFCLQWASYEINLEDEETSLVAGKVGYAPAPYNEATGIAYSELTFDYFYIPKNISVNPEAVFLSLAEMTSYEAQTKVLDAGLVTRQSIYADNPDIYTQHPAYAAVNATVEQGDMPSNAIKYPFFGNILTVFGTAISEAIAGSVTPQQALDKAVADCATLMVDQGYLSA